MPNHYGVVKVILAKEIPKAPVPFPDADAAVEFVRRRAAALTGDRSSSAGWPKITKCFQRDAILVFDAHDAGFEASISFGIGDQKQKHTYTLKTSASRGVETGLVEHVETLENSTLKESEWLHSDAFALGSFPYRFVVFTRAENRARTLRAWLVGISEFSVPAVNETGIDQMKHISEL